MVSEGISSLDVREGPECPAEREGGEGIEQRLTDNGSISVPGLAYSESLAFGNGIP